MTEISSLIHWESFGEGDKRRLAPILDSLGTVNVTEKSPDRDQIIRQIKSLPENLKQPLWDMIVENRFFLEWGPVSIYEPFGRLVRDSGSETYFANSMARKYPDELLDAIRIQRSTDPDLSDQRDEQKLYYNEYFVREENVKAAADASPFTYLSLKDKLELKASVDWPQYTDEDVAIIAHLSSFESVLTQYDNFKNRANSTEIMVDQARSQPALAVDSYDRYKNLPFARAAIEGALDKAPGLYFNRYKEISSRPELSGLYTQNDQENVKKAALSRPDDFVKNIALYKNEPFAVQAITEFAKNAPDEILMGAKYIGPAYGAKYIEEAFGNDLDLGIARLKNGWIELEQLPHLGSILADRLPAYLDGSYDPENILLVVNYLNYLHEESPAVRFEAVSKLDASGYFITISEGRSEAYTSTFNHLFNQFTSSLAKEHKSFNDFLNEKPERIQQLQPFLDGVSSFGRFPDLMKSMDTADKMLFVDTILKGDKPQVTQVIALANLVRNLPADDRVMPYIETKILHGYATAPNYQIKNLYGVLGQWYAERPGANIQSENAGAFKAITSQKDYTLPNFERVDSSLLFDAQKRNFQMHLFYNDADGVASYDYFHQRMQREGWKETLNAKDGIVHFSKRDQDRTVNVYATIPHKGKDLSPANDAAAEKIKAEIASQGGKLTFVAHRGHSYHVNDTINQLTGSEQIVYLGACGGTEYIAATLENSPEADIIATSGEGTKFVNEPLLADITNRILKGQSIVWKDVEKTVSAIGDPRAQSYMMPSQNMAAVFISKMMSIEDLNEAIQPSASSFNDNFTNAAEAAPAASQVPQSVPVRALDAPAPAVQ